MTAQTLTSAPLRRFANAADYRKRFIIREQIDRYLPGGRHYLDEAELERLLAAASAAPANDPVRVREILAKSRAIETLLPEETASLIQVTDPALLDEMETTALAIKHAVYDNRIVMFAPLYMSNLCVNRCAYCGFRCGNEDQKRRMLTMDEVRQEVDVLAGKIGHKRLIAVYGEHPDTSTEYFAETIRTVYAHQVKSPQGTPVGIRRVNVNAAPLPIEDLRVLKQVGIGTFQVFQETYHRATYARLHPADTVKGDYDWRTTCFHRALEAGVDDVGMGVLYGLYDWKFELLASLCHARDLERQFGIGPHTISFPRLEPASGTDLPTTSPYRIDDATLRRILIITRLSVPYTGMIVTCRERPESRDAFVRCGITQMDASSNIAIKGYSDFASETHQEKHRQQFVLSDTRTLEELIAHLAREGIITSFCTAGYRCGRTGGCIMDALKTGKEGKFCKINAVLTFREWLDDFASAATRMLCEPLLRRELAEIETTLPKFYPTVKEHYDRIANGERDLFF
ncbi:MAG TPA: [FeFe] hydrogenase H-cluster radical SAM maturase HydG [Kiritimatiellia bacterium]|jgi:2-iminoacetate synthase|nr:[FeFe] hydrogenase H-cluster radical SAM maturase HydG [Kiritimatiellia bacterium]HOM58234.1 [FeFe] hydrogenase H-cluster radical SAM maturase HydG [Kiritimatiellia bacterium]HOR96918.1 [FeFe] hydrogenase H-cluster radical SAM maturase HydG [Kiritimatiellia bacterium]HPC49448.1 [FeFe] hydrogenase H-cluster radical SAM maturase HydG [Kiritimatiellia bacterium]HPK37929.1 [FeFe] hydrogenase H-cluster radical SAM maturase HydG [Kiritimatiellia bacterium]